MNTALAFVVGILQTALSLLGFVQQHPELPPTQVEQVQQVAQQAVEQASQTISNTQAPSPAETVAGPYALKHFQNADYGISFDYPSKLEVKMSEANASQDSVAQGIVSILAQYPYGAASQYSAEKFDISVSADPTAVGNCKVVPPSDERSIKSDETRDFGGTRFVHYGVGDVAMGHATSQDTYRAIKNNVCITFTFTRESTAESRLEQAAIASQRAALKEEDAQMKVILDSLKVIDSAAASAAPPTCALQASPLSLKVGDVVTLTWNSKGATKAFWDQEPDKNTGARAKFIAPAGTPAVSGTATTVANLEGYHPYTLQVIGPGGYGKCTASIWPTHSDVKPSVTIKGVSVLRSPSEYSKANNDVIIYGSTLYGGLLNDNINLVLINPDYTGPFDQGSVYAQPKGSIWYSGGASFDTLHDSKVSSEWSEKSYLPASVTRVRVLAYPYFSNSSQWSQKQPLANTVVNVDGGTATAASSDVSVPGMSKYTDSDFGFSFWYPASMSVSTKPGRTDEWMYGIGTVVRRTVVGPEFTIDEVYSPDRSILSSVDAGCCGSSDDKYFFDPQAHTWMQYDDGGPKGGSAGNTLADTSRNTMGGLHIFTGYTRFGIKVIIPLSAHNFLAVYSKCNEATDYSCAANGGQDKFNKVLQTITATDPSVATPVSIVEQIKTIQAEKDAYSGQ